MISNTKTLLTASYLELAGVIIQGIIIKHHPAGYGHPHSRRFISWKLHTSHSILTQARSWSSCSFPSLLLTSPSELAVFQRSPGHRSPALDTRDTWESRVTRSLAVDNVTTRLGVDKVKPKGWIGVGTWLDWVWIGLGDWGLKDLGLILDLGLGLDNF